MKKLKKILIGIDFSGHSKAALSQAIRIAERHRSELHLAHVIDEHAVAKLKDAFKLSKKSLHTELKQTVKDRITKVLENFPKLGKKPKLHTIAGNPIYSILKLAKEKSIDLIVLGSIGADKQQSGVGSVAVQCIRYSGKNVLLVRKSHSNKFKKITVCVDFSDTSRVALEQAIAVAQQDGARLSILHVFVPPWKILHYHSAAPSSKEFKKEFIHEESDQLAQFLKPFNQHLENLSWDPKVKESLKPSDGIIDYLKRSHSDLAVVGTRGRSILGLFHLGTTAERVIQESSCSVLMVKPKDAAFSIA